MEQVGLEWGERERSKALSCDWWRGFLWALRPHDRYKQAGGERN